MRLTGGNGAAGRRFRICWLRELACDYLTKSEELSAIRMIAENA